MKKKKSSIRKKYEYVNLYKDDLINIFNILKKYSEKITISTKEFEFNEISEIDKLEGEKINYLEFAITNPTFLTISFYSYEIEINSSGNSLEIETIIYQIEKLIKLRTSEIKKFYKEKSTFLFLLIALISYLLGKFFIEIQPIYSVWSFASATFFFFLFAITSYLTSRINCVDIHNSYLKENPSFIKRNKDEIIIGFLIGFFFLICGYLLGKFT